MKKIYYWSPCLNKVGTYKSTINSAISLSRYSKKNYQIKIINTCGQWNDCEELFRLNNIEVIHFICDILDQLEPEGYPYRDLIEFVDDRPGHDHRYGIDNSKIKSLGWDPAFSWENGLIDVIEWYLKNKNFLVSKGENIYSGERLGKL